MTEVLLTGVGLLAIMGLWKFVWLPTILDATRDKLFDLRDDVLKGYFVKNGISFDHPTYVKLRNLLNGHLRHTESVTIWEVIFVKRCMDGNPALRFAEIEAIFQTDDPKLQALVDEIRFKSAVAMLIYMFATSLACIALAIPSSAILLLRKLPFKAIYSTKPAVKARTVMEEFALIS